MAHPLVPLILELATLVADSLDLEVVSVVFHTNQNPPVLRVDVCGRQRDTGLEDCERMSHALDAVLDEAETIPDAYVLEVSSPGIPQSLTTDREFTSFKGFPVEVATTEAVKGHTLWNGLLIRRDDEAVYINLKGRAIALPRHLVKQVQLTNGEEP
ncbi:MAG: ribosome maturation factor RimP [Kaiparowitsia implicata GSE-PSE-MK54-09C]|jgi:ribosome maturation factor RimP|nr:ribosome maturation factor RimP [Kaiparowitsia implicata GSE-PSE-MK54-09C]